MYNKKQSIDKQTVFFIFSYSINFSVTSFADRNSGDECVTHQNNLQQATRHGELRSEAVLSGIYESLHDLFDGEDEVKHFVAILDSDNAAVVLGKFHLDCFGVDDLQAIVDILGVIRAANILAV